MAYASSDRASARPRPNAPVVRRRRGGQRPLGPFSFLVMRTLQELRPRDCYGLMIEQHLSEFMRELIDLSQVYVTLKRLQGQDLLTAKPAQTPNASGHTVMLYRLTPAGKQAIKHATEFYRALARLLPPT